MMKNIVTVLKMNCIRPVVFEGTDQFEVTDLSPPIYVSADLQQ
jgi:hypothetical protein